MSFEYLHSYTTELKNGLDKLNLKKIQQVQSVLIECAAQSRTIFICGNGGSSSTAGHFAVDLNKGASERTKIKFKALSLNEHMASITAISNDLHYSKIFAHQFGTFAEEGDVLFCISASGNSLNILEVANLAKDSGHIVIGLTGFNGGELSKILDLELNISSQHMGIIEDLHSMACHMISFGINE